MRPSILLALCQIATVPVLLAVWQWASVGGYVSAAYFGAPLATGALLWSMLVDGSVIHHIGQSMIVLGAGFAGGMILGMGIGIITGISRWANDILEPIIIFFNGMPWIILQPFFVVWLGFGYAPKISLVVAVIVVMVAVSTSAALKEVDRDIKMNARILGAGTWGMVTEVYAPSLTLAMISTSRINLAFAFQATLVSEFVGTADGLGFLIIKGQQTHDVNLIWVALVVVVILSSAIDLIVTRIERYSLRWMYS